MAKRSDDSNSFTPFEIGVMILWSLLMLVVVWFVGHQTIRLLGNLKIPVATPTHTAEISTATPTHTTEISTATPTHTAEILVVAPTHIGKRGFVSVNIKTVVEWSIFIAAIGYGAGWWITLKGRTGESAGGEPCLQVKQKCRNLEEVEAQQRQELRLIRSQLMDSERRKGRALREAGILQNRIDWYRTRWGEAKKDLNTALATELVVFSLEERDEDEALIAPDPAESYYGVALRQTLDLLLGNLESEKQRMALELRFGLTGEEPLTYREIGARMGGITQEAVRGHINNGLRKLRRPSRKKVLKDFLY